MKTCPSCKEKKSLNNFHKDSSRKDGLKVYCKACIRKEYLSESGREKTWNALLKNNYGISLEEYKKEYEKQDGQCAICNSPLDFRGQKTHVDHNHKTGKFRGILCYYCNTRRVAFVESQFFNKTLEYLGLDSSKISQIG